MFCTPLPATDSVERIGGKAAGASRVPALGVGVPRTVVLESGALRAFLEENALWTRVVEYTNTFPNRAGAAAEAAHRELVDAVHAGTVPAPVAGELRHALEDLLSTATCGLAVRSSAVYEDSVAASFAGVFESWLGLTDRADIERRIRDCWCAAWAPRAMRYLARMGLEPRPDAMAVLLQEVVPAVSSGVVFTVDPDNGDPWAFVVRATPGLSIDLMSGSAEGDSFRLEWDTGVVTEREVVAKPSLLAATDAGVVRRSRSDELARRPALGDAELSEAAGVARRLDEAFGVRLDVEFVFAPDGLWVVQARPLTALPPFFPCELSAADRDRTWRRAAVLPARGDVPAGFLTPLYRDLSEAEMWARYQPDDIVLAVFCEESRDAGGYRFSLAQPTPLCSDFFEAPSGYEAWLEENEPCSARRLAPQRPPGPPARVRVPPRGRALPAHPRQGRRLPRSTLAPPRPGRARVRRGRDRAREGRPRSHRGRDAVAAPRPERKRRAGVS